MLGRIFTGRVLEGLTFRRLARRLGLRARMIRHPNRVAATTTILLGLLVVAGPVRFGGVLPPDRTLLDLVALAAFVLVLLGRRTGMPTDGVKAGLRSALPAAAALAGVALFGLLQSLPWPSPVVGLLSPRAAELWSETRLLLAPGGEGQGGWWMPFSLAPEASRITAVHWLAVVAAFLAAAGQGAIRGARRAMVFCLVGSVVFQVFYGAHLWAAKSSRILGVEVAGGAGRLRGTFVNPDHFAFYLGLALPCAFAALWWIGRRMLRRRESVESGVGRLALALLFFFLVAGGIGLSGSRSGLVAALAVLVIQGAVLAHRYRRWRGAAWGVAGLGAAGLGLLLFGWRHFFARWGQTSVYELAWNERVETWWASLSLWLDFPLAGTGMGSFRFAFPLTQPRGAARTWTHAHSDLLEVLVTTGVVGALLLAAAMVAVVPALWEVARRGRRSEDRAAGLAALGGLTYAFFHSLTDFGLTLPANAFALAVLCGLAAGAPTGRRKKKRSGLTVHLDEAEEETETAQKTRATAPGTT